MVIYCKKKHQVLFNAKHNSNQVKGGYRFKDKETERSLKHNSHVGDMWFNTIYFETPLNLII